MFKITCNVKDEKGLKNGLTYLKSLKNVQNDF
jgi:hypothetical protein